MSGGLTITIGRRFRGPEESGNGGYSCGAVARHIRGDAEVTLRRPPPLERTLDVRQSDAGIEVSDGDDLIAEGRPTTFAFDIPDPPSMAQSEQARRRYSGYLNHAFPTCFVCGTDRAADGLMIHPGQVEGREVWAAPFIPDPSLPAGHGLLEPEMVWSALDCPGAWAVERDTKDRPVVLGRMAAHLERPAPTDRAYIAVGWPIGIDGRKLYSRTGLFDADGTCYGWASQTWIVLG